MLFFEGYFAMSVLSKYMQPTANMMKSINHHVLMTQEDLDIFVSRLKLRLSQDAPKRSKARIDLSDSQINLFPDEYSWHGVVKISFHPVQGFLQFNAEAGGYEYLNNVDIKI